MLVMEFIPNREMRRPYPEAASRVLRGALSRGLLTLKVEPYNRG